MNKLKVPQLRFKGFEGEWKFKKIGNIAELTSSKRVYLTDYVEEGIPFYRGKEISELKLGKIPNDILYITESSYQEFKEKFGVPQKDDLLITAVGTLGNVLRIKDEAKFYFKDGNLIWFRKITEFSPFLEIALDFYKSEIEKTSIGSTQRALTMVELRKLKFPFPTLPEQQKIASFLSAVDEKIQQLSRKKELLEQYKKGVMQQLFSGKLRFKNENGKEYPDWEEKKLGDFCTFFSGGTPTSTNQNYYSGTIPFIGSGNIYDSEVYNFISEQALNSSSAKMVEKGDLLYALYGANSGELAISKMSGAINQAILCIRNEECIEYLYYILLLNKDNIVAKYLQGGQGNLSAQIIKRLKYKFPSLPEQQKIANFLSGIDGKIEQVNGELVKTQEFKKGLLQQMFV
ncbi:hypothetical protein FVB9288_01027 [Flavobacterium sp. CECT 9288]|uniref:restriction endonuclease subunit S n=1 Tax=Flavobacterium sp. CECT 9288 TaxID=2845819 RepID=UPI001E5BDE9E|nr:restriction endonuclease subunit S [Flavobacterium sp. CECT 9288]CAH0335386.1 hypothetical protein FVB9288_01027 [Flavobacterium sp. CECT 9288]